MKTYGKVMTKLAQINFKNKDVFETFERYPSKQCDVLLSIRQLIFDAAAENSIEGLEETLKWGEPSYLTKKGSTIRLAWRKSFPKQVGVFFHCQTSLIETFKEIYRHEFTFEGNRAIIFKDGDHIPVDALKHCISLSLTYHEIKHLPLLGI